MSGLLEFLRGKSATTPLTLSQVCGVISEGRLTVRKVDQFLFYLLANKVPEIAHLKASVLNGGWQTKSEQDISSLIAAALKYHRELESADFQGNEFYPKEPDSKEQSKQTPEHNPEVLNSDTPDLEEDTTVVNILRQLEKRKSEEYNKDGSRHKDESRHTKKGRKQGHKEETTEMEGSEKELQLKHKLKAKLRVIFDHYRKEMPIVGESFQDNQKRSEHIDLRTFMKYYRDFQIALAYPACTATTIFRRLAMNSLRLDYPSFLLAHLQLVELQAKDGENIKKLRDLHDVVSSRKIRKMLNLSANSLINLVVREHSGHTGAFKVDIVRRMNEKMQERQLRLAQKYNNPKSTNSPRKQIYRSEAKLTSIKKGVQSHKQLPRHLHEKEHTVYQELSLPKMRVHELKEQSIYAVLSRLRVGGESEVVKELVDIGEDEEYLRIYLKGEKREKQSASKRKGKPEGLPSMKFS